MDDQMTCGKGVAAQATLPAALSDVVAAMAEVLDLHQEALDLTDPNARPEHHAYVTLVIQLRRAAAELTSIAERMRGYRDLPMGRHDEKRMAASDAVDAFSRFIEAERGLQSLLNVSVQEGSDMLARMR